MDVCLGFAILIVAIGFAFWLAQGGPEKLAAESRKRDESFFKSLDGWYEEEDEDD